MPSKKEKKGRLRALYIRLASLNDLARNAATEKTYLLAVKAGGMYKLICPGERAGEARILYYYETKSMGRYLVYSADEENGEKVEMADNVAERPDRYKSQKIPIIELEKDPYASSEKGDLKEMKTVEAKDPSALARALINSMAEDEPPKLYSFAAGKDRVIGTLSLLEGQKVFVCSRVGSKEIFSRINYDYTNDTVVYTNSIGGASKINISVINLAEQPLFFSAKK